MSYLNLRTCGVACANVIVAALIGLLALGCDQTSEDANLETRVDELVAEMTLEEKVAQMAGAGSEQAPYSVPGVPRLGIPTLETTDGPRGVGAQQGTTQFPVGMARGASWDPELELRVGQAMGLETRAAGANVLLAPTINNLRHPRWGRGQETYGEDVHLLKRMGVAFVQGAQEHAMASVKHLAAYSIQNTRFDVDVLVDERTLREIYLPHFRAAVQEAGAASVMTAYNQVNGLYCGENEYLVRQILKDEWRFDGFVISDWFLGTRSTVPAALAGLDIEMPAPRFFGDALLDAVESGDVPPERIDDAVKRIVRKKLAFNLDEPSAVDESVIASDAHLQLAQEAARSGVVLLKNEGDALPLDRQGLTRLAVVGSLADTPNTGDTGSSDTSPSFIVTPLEGIEDAVAGDDVVVDHIGRDVLEPADRDVIEQADAAVVVAGFTATDTGEFVGDLETLALSPERENLIKEVAALNPRTIVVLQSGTAITMGGWIAEPPAVLMSWYSGQMGGHGIADLLFGDASPAGKLPLTIPRSETDLPPFDNESEEVTYSYFHGYRHVDREGLDPEFEFGFGLSYTTFSLDNLQVETTGVGDEDAVRVSVDVTNTGTTAGAEVAQAYVSYPGSSVERANLELKGFQKVFLESGETKTASIEIPLRDLAYFDVSTRAWVIEPLEYRVHVGTSSRDLPLSDNFRAR
ncbi:MAG: glycoside hydrolase family 3 C-terminal domain-containing protein [Deltaproteobacteria bacterium]|nr:glycoside hydrolase family 3 C-terminal domain-containing protein [Deltaproteobacteria bacterium]MBT8466956.1 glycoside hydrolase family 3 C-terminal domain-containing protein [Deltaproteobacteria bacterium]NND29795.1 glycosyl hydrolase [Myxococcales bacterium]NNK07696.1 glycosyl hydrolase [Myxococcales bacterium]NNK42448.1 glycosyl hydrolase [Myxococcales bacterium]